MIESRKYNDILRAFTEDIFPYNDFEINTFQNDDSVLIKCLNELSGTVCFGIHDAYIEFVKCVSSQLLKAGSYCKKTSAKIPFSVNFPKELGGRKIIKQMKNLVDSEDYHEWFLYHQKKDFFYSDLKVIEKNYNIIVNRKLRNMGDCFAMESKDYKTQFYLVYREIKLQKAKAVMREHIYYALSEYIRKNNLGLYFILKNLCYPTDYDRILREFTERKIGMAETLKK